MSRTLNRALLQQLARNNKVALEDQTAGDDTPPVVVPATAPVEGSAETTPAAVAAATGEQGQTDPAAEAPAAPTVIIKVEVEQASKPAEPAVVTEVPAGDVAPTGGDAVAAAATDEAAASAETAVDAAAGEAPAAATADVPGDTTAVPAEAAAEVPTETLGDVAAAPEGGEAAAQAAPAATTDTPPAEGATDAASAADAIASAAAEPAAETPPATAADAAPEGGAEGGEGGEAATAPTDAGSADNTALPEEAAAAAAEAPAEGAGEVTDAQVDGKPTEAEKDEAAEEVQAAIAAAKGEEEVVVAAAKEEMGAPAVEPAAASNADAVEDALPMIEEVEMHVAEDPAPEIEAIATEIDGYQGGAETMERIGEVLAEAAEEGGLNESGAKVLEVAVEGFHKLMALPAPKGILAMECFAEPGTRISATTIALEAVTETAKAAWKTVWAAIQEWLGKLGDFYNKLASGALIQGKRAEGILAAVAKMGDKSGEGMISSPTLVKALSRGSSVSKNIPGEMLAMNKVVDAAIGHGSALAAAVPGLVNGLDVGASKEAFVKLVTQHVASVLKPDSNLSDVGVADAPEGTNGYSTQPMLGNVVLWAYVPKSAESLGKLNFGRHVFEAEGGTGGGELPVLNTAQIKALASIVLNMSKSLADLRKAEQAVKAAAAAFGQYIQKGEQAGEAKPDGSLAHALRQNTAGLLMHASKMGYTVNSSALAYCEASLKKLSGGEQAAAAPAAA